MPGVHTKEVPETAGRTSGASERLLEDKLPVRELIDFDSPCVTGEKEIERDLIDFSSQCMSGNSLELEDKQLIAEPEPLTLRLPG